MTLPLMLDTFVIAALCGCIGYAVFLQLKLRRLKDAVEGLQPALEDFAAAAQRTEGSVQSLRSVADHISADARRKAGGWWTTDRADTKAGAQPTTVRDGASAGKAGPDPQLLRRCTEIAGMTSRPAPLPSVCRVGGGRDGARLWLMADLPKGNLAASQVSKIAATRTPCRTRNARRVRCANSPEICRTVRWPKKCRFADRPRRSSPRSSWSGRFWPSSARTWPSGARPSNWRASNSSSRQIDSQRLRDEIAALLERVEAAQNEDLERLVRIYRNMTPEEAAAIIEDLDMETTVMVLGSRCPNGSRHPSWRTSIRCARGPCRASFLERSKLPADQDLSNIVLR
jgi:hypothetical protein